MKKLYTTLVALLAIIQFSYAQTNTAWSTTGSIGIGTTSPNASLEVVGSNGAFSTTAHTTANFVQDHINYRGVYLGFDSANQIGIVAGSSGGNASNLAFWNYSGTNWFEAMRLTSNGNLGIGTTNPQSKLDVNGSISMQNFGHISSQRGSGNNFTNLFLGGSINDNGDGSFTVFGDGGSNYFSAIRMDNSGSNVGAINFYTGVMTGGSSYNITNASLATYQRMTIVGGNVGIGTATPKETLSVNGNIRSKQVKVETANWPDYVFKKEYNLPSLSEVKSYIDQNQHLPEMPSEAEVVKDGLNLGEMNKLLTKKVEELTLYLIEQQKVNQSLQEQINNLSKKVDASNK